MTPLDEQTKALLARLKEGGFRPAHQVPVEESRAGLEEMAAVMAGPKQDVHETEDRAIPGPGGDIPIRIYRPSAMVDGETLGVAVYFHGGGFYLGDLESHDHVCRFLCKHGGVVVVAVDYRLAPEHKFPAAIEDCYAALAWVAEQGEAIGVDPARIALVGDSAGGTLVASVCLMARDKGGPAIALQIPVYPALTVEDGEDFPSRRELGTGDYFIAYEDFAFFREIYLADPEKDVSNPLASPIRADDFSGLPAALIIAAEYDPCRDENEVYAERLRAAGVDAEYVCFNGTIHPFFLFDGVIDAGKEGQKLVANKLCQALSA